MTKHEKLLKFYIEKVLFPSSYLSPPFSYSILPFTGHLFRNWSGYTPTVILENGLNIGKDMLKKFLNIDEREAINIMKNYLKFESRVLIERDWIIMKDTNKMFKAFNSQDINSLIDKISNKQSVIFTLHSVNFTLMIALIGLLNEKTSVMKGPITVPYFLHNYMVDAYKIWEKYQRHTKSNIEDARKTLSLEYSLFIVGDAPPRRNGIKIKFLNKNINVASGAIRLSYEFGLPLLIAIPWTENTTSKYKIYLHELEKTGDVQKDMQNIFSFCEKIILLNPSCWMGWMALESMLNE